MKKAFGLLEILIVTVIIIVVYFTCFYSSYGRKDPFDDNSQVNTKTEMIDDTIKDIEDNKALKKRIENNLKEGY